MEKNYEKVRGKCERERKIERVGEKRLSLSSGCSRTREREPEGKREIERNEEGRGREEAHRSTREGELCEGMRR